MTTLRITHLALAAVLAATGSMAVAQSGAGGSAGSNTDARKPASSAHDGATHGDTKTPRKMKSKAVSAASAPEGPNEKGSTGAGPVKRDNTGGKSSPNGGSR